MNLMVQLRDNFRENWGLWIVLILGFLIRLYVFAHTYVINPDGIFYIYQAKAISNGMWDDATSCGFSFVSIYPFLIIPFYEMFNEWVIAAKATSLFFGTFTIIPLYFLMKRFLTKELTIITTLVFAFNPVFVERSVDVIKEPIFWFFAVLGLYLFVRAIDKDKGRIFILSSLSFCLGSLARIESMVLFFGFPFVFIPQKEKGPEH